MPPFIWKALEDENSIQPKSSILFFLHFLSDTFLSHQYYSVRLPRPQNRKFGFVFQHPLQWRWQLHLLDSPNSVFVLHLQWNWEDFRNFTQNRVSFFYTSSYVSLNFRTPLNPSYKAFWDEWPTLMSRYLCYLLFYLCLRIVSQIVSVKIAGILRNLRSNASRSLDKKIK